MRWNIFEKPTPKESDDPGANVIFEDPKPTEKREEEADKNNYESVVTNSYFESWDEGLKLEGNPELKEQIKHNVIEAERRNQNLYEDVAANLRITVEELKARLQAKVEYILERSEFFIATDLSVLEKVMNVDGRWKSQFETGKSGGVLDRSYRAGYEMVLFGFNKTSGEAPNDPEEHQLFPSEVLENNKTKRPIYGYFSDEEHGAMNRQGKIPPPTNLIQYGKVNIKINKGRALKKATVSFYDSLCPAGTKWPPTPAIKPHFIGVPLDKLKEHSRDEILDELKMPSVASWGTGDVNTEVQYHNGLTMEDIESIHVSIHNDLHPEDVEEVRKIFQNYKVQHPESTIQLIEF